MFRLALVLVLLATAECFPDSPTFWTLAEYAISLIKPAALDVIFNDYRLEVPLSELAARLAPIRLPKEPLSDSEAVLYVVPTVRKFLQEMAQWEVVPDPKSAWILLFAKAEDWDVEDLLLRLWTDHRLYNVFAIIDDSPNLVHTYDPAPRKVRVIEDDGTKDGKRLFGKELRNWAGAEFHVVAFARAPSLLIGKAGDTSGYDARILQLITTYLNMTTWLEGTSDGQRYGFKTDGGAIVGTLKSLVEGKADFTGNGHFIKWYDIPELDFTHFVTAEQLCVVVPKPGRLPHVLLLLRTFNSAAWLLFLLIYAVIGVIYLLLEKNRRSDPLATFLDMYQVALGMSVVYKIRGGPERLLFGSLLVASLVLVNYFQGTLTTFLSAPLVFKNIDTLAELKESQIEIWISSKDMTTSLGSDPSLEGVNFRLINEEVWAKSSQREEINGRLVRLNVMYNSKSKEYRGIKTWHAQHVVSECLATYFIAYVMPRGAPWSAAVDRMISRLLESGLIPHWVRQAGRSVLGPTQSSLPPTHKPLTLADLFFPFAVLQYGGLFASIIFLIELVLGKLLLKKYCRSLLPMPNFQN